MTSVTVRLASLALFASLAGCSTFNSHDRQEECENPHRRWSDEWYACEAAKPVGTRQVEKHGKLWPPYPRPVGEELEMSHKYHAAHYWPWPYECADRAYVHEVNHRQIANGWMAETTLHDYHFNPETNELNQAGQMHLRWILENAIDEFRVAWVQTAPSPEISQVRLASVEANAIEMVGPENVPPIMLRVATPQGRPALEIMNMREGEIESMPQPRLQYVSPSSSSTGGGS